ncbi:ubiquitin fusion degradation protein 1-like [Heracleum sosnowskyi]|uniref:Ubiquitin fusion degradation protein 1-like n=1 Tax=Heracleum sosnowskyi TaxID=360622 RepID=A0AAD8HIN5_9APIA|nr:ubiquitin fusion degradation protein 1-like [Heracleum sosnowskyi]
MHHCEDGNKIIMPPSALEELMLMKKISYPMTFKIINPFLKNYSHCGVLEFSGEEGCVFLPNWMMNSLLLDQGQVVNIEYNELPKGQSLKIQPHSSEFVMNLSDPKEVMEKILKDFACVTIGDTIMVNHENQSYYIDIVETRPHEAVSLFETDCELEFERPLDYKEPEKIKPKVEQVEEVKDTTNVEKDAVFNQVEEVKDTINLEKDAVFKPFTGVSRRLDGQVSVSAPPPVVAAEDDKKLVADSRRHARIVICGLDGISSAAKEKAKTEETEDVKGKTKENTEEKKFQPFTGKKYILSSCC